MVRLGHSRFFVWLCDFSSMIGTTSHSLVKLFNFVEVYVFNVYISLDIDVVIDWTPM